MNLLLMSELFLFIGGSEIVVILLIVVMLFGADKIPEIARGLGKGLQEIKNASNDIKREINSQSGGVAGMAKDIKDTAEESRRKMQDMKGTVSREIHKTFMETDTSPSDTPSEKEADQSKDNKQQD